MSDSQKTQLGKILLKQKLVSTKELETLLDEQSRDHERLASKVLEKGLTDETHLLKALSEQSGVPAINLDEIEIDLAVLDTVPRDIATSHLILPVAMTHDAIQLVMANPDDRRVVDEIEFVSGKKVFPHVALHAQLVPAIEQAYRDRESGQRWYRGRKLGAVGIGSTRPTAGHRPEPSAVQTVISDNAGRVHPSLAGDDEIVFDTIDDGPAAPAPNLPPLPRPGVSISMQVPKALEGPSALNHLPVPPPSRPPGPRPPSRAVPAAVAPAAAPATGAFKVLVVDDSDDIRLLICKVLSDKGYQVVDASRGGEALKKVQSENPDMLVLDAMLPEVHGFDICKKIKGSAKYGHIPVIMISAIYRGWRYARDLKDSYGVDDFIEKPFKINELIEKVEKFAKKGPATPRRPEEDLSQEAERYLAAGIQAFRGGDVDKAIELLRKGVSIDPLAFKLHYHLALLLGKKDLHYQAIGELESALELVPEHFAALKNLAVLYQRSGFKLKAIETWERALTHSPDEPTRQEIKSHLMTLL